MQYSDRNLLTDTAHNKLIGLRNTGLRSSKKLVGRHPFVLFGLPLLALIVGGSFALSHLTQTKIDYNKLKIKPVSEEDAAKLQKKTGKKFDIREEYFRLQTGLDTENWTMVPLDKSDEHIPLSIEEAEQKLNERFQRDKIKMNERTVRPIQ